MRRSVSGFTIVELLVVIAIIGILTAIGVASFTRYQANTRDTQRASKTAIIAEGLEKYYDKNGEYPSCSALTQPASVVDTSVLPGIDPLALLTPESAPTDTNSIKCTDLTSPSTSPDIYAYVGDGSAACLSGASCLSWTLKYTDETTGTVKTIQSRRNTSIATSGTSTLTASPVGFTQINLSWTPINNAISYQVQQATDAGFTTNLINTTVPGTSLSATGLAYNTTYYFRVMPNAADSTGTWSNTVAMATWGLATPVASATATSTTSFNVTWSTVPYATNYTIQLSSDGTTWSTGWQVTGATTSPQSFPNAQPGWKYYVRMQAISGPYASSWSGTASTALPIDTPVVSAVVNSSTTFTSSWAAIAGAYSYNVQCSGDNVTWGSGCAASTTGLSFGWGPTWEGRPLYFRTQAVGESTIGNWSASVGATTWIDTPPAPTYLSPGSFASNVSAVVNYASYCPANTSPVSTTFRSQDWYGVNWGPHPWGYNDSWQNANGVNKSVQYWGHYQCQTPYVTSAMSPESYNVITVTP